MERNKPKKNSVRAHANTDEEFEEPLGPSVFDYNELAVIVFSNLLVSELFTVALVSKKFNLLSKEPTIWKNIFLNHFGSEYWSAIQGISGADLQRAVKEPEFAHQIMNYNLDGFEGIEWNQRTFAVPESSTKEAIINYIFNAKPVWRSPFFGNDQTDTSELFLLPQFQMHQCPTFDPLFIYIFFNYYGCGSGLFTPIELLSLIIDRANGTPDARNKAISLLCQWMANYDFLKHREQLDAPLNLFLDTAKEHEIEQINHALHLATLPKEFSWQANDEKFRAKLSEKQLKPLKCNVKAKLLVEPINIFDIPVEEMAKQVALSEQQKFRELKYGHFVKAEWRASGIVSMFNKRSVGITALILTQPTRQQRAEAYTYFLKLGQELVHIRCFNAATIVLSAISSASIFRLLTAKEANKKYSKEIEQLRAALSNEKGFKMLRNLMSGYDRPAVPYLGLTYVDLTFIEDGSYSFTENKINWSKFTRIYAVICNAMKYQLRPYLYEAVPSLQQAWNNIETNLTDDQLYQYSNIIFPKGATKENENPFDEPKN